MYGVRSLTKRRPFLVRVYHKGRAYGQDMMHMENEKSYDGTDDSSLFL